jgi:hypothetical protein
VPYTLGHAVLLQRLGSPLAMAEQRPCTLGDVTVAAWVCSRPVPVARRHMDGWWMRQWMVYHAMVWGAHQVDRAREFATYIAAAWHVPDVRATRSGGRRMGSDPVHLLWLHRRSVMGDTDAQAAECLVLRARLDMFAWAEREGMVRIVEDEEEDTVMAACAENAEWDRAIRGGAHVRN